MREGPKVMMFSQKGSVLLCLLIMVALVASQLQPRDIEGSTRSSMAHGDRLRNGSDARMTNDAICDHPIWCTIDPPATSLFRFSDPPNDTQRWERAKRLAASSEPVLLQHILPHFPNYFDFLDGDTSMRIYHGIADYFLDNNHGFEVLSRFHPGYRQGVPPRQNALGKRYQPYRWEKNPNQHVLPPPYHLHNIKRAPVIHIGYFAFDRPFARDTSLPFGGKFIGEAIIERDQLIRMWRYGRKKIHRPWIGLHAANENWGLFSSYFPNRTTDWGSCCLREAGVHQMLEHPMTLLFLTNQHHNLTHPKLLSLPRGLPIHGDHNRRVIFDLMREMASSPSKHTLMFTASSNWGYRPTILHCLSRKFDPSEVTFRLHKANKHLQGRTSFMETYRRIARARFSIALPGLGYDTFRVWESLTMGTIPILERGIGLDKTLWRLPALLVDDFDLVTPALLHTAYVEALYRAPEFEFERLTQSFWWTFIMNVSRSSSIDTVLDKFPRHSEDATFVRPLERFTCHETQSCGPGTKRIPASFC